jgi:hypothetical protein
MTKVKEFCGRRLKRFAFVVAPLKRRDNYPLQIRAQTIIGYGAARIRRRGY